MASSSGDEGTSIGASSLLSTGQNPSQEPVPDSTSMSGPECLPDGSGPTARPSRTFHQNGEWDQYKPILRRMYMDEKKTLVEVRERMRTQHNFTASAKMYKTRFIAWGWRKNIKLTPGLDPKEVKDTPYEDTVRPGTRVRLANGQLVDTSRLQKHLRRKRVYPTVSLTTVVRPPDSHHVTEAVFAYTRRYSFGRHEKEITSLTEAVSIVTLDQPSTNRWFHFTNGINDAMKENNVSQALVQMRRAPGEIAIMFRAEPSTTICNIFMLIVQLNRHAEAAGADAEQFRVLLKSLLRYAASLGFSGMLGVPSSHPLPHLMQSLAVVSPDELVEVAIRAWKVTCQAWAEMAFANYFPSTVGTKSLATWLRTGHKTEMDGVWFFQLIGSLIDEQLQTYEHMYGTQASRYHDTIQAKVELLSFMDKAKGKDCYHNPRIVGLYQQMLDHGAQGHRRTSALRFIAKASARTRAPASDDSEGG